MARLIKTCLCFLIIALLASFYPAASQADGNHDKVIWIDQVNEVGAAYDDGKKLLAFPVLSGDDETPTPPGTYVIKRKDRNYYSRKYKQPMPYALFFDLRGMRAIHEGDLPEPGEWKEWATHGCIHVAEPYMKQLFDWAEEGKTVVVIHGQRTYEEPKHSRREEKQYQ
ncbi:MAG: L,D-transpeptidase, partial [Deltaproteobacteria bacterium]|nr:L,D-transpeptidase [Deltaproteobacteria bacterium]